MDGFMNWVSRFRGVWQNAAFPNISNTYVIFEAGKAMLAEGWKWRKCVRWLKNHGGWGLSGVRYLPGFLTLFNVRPGELAKDL